MALPSAKLPLVPIFLAAGALLSGCAGPAAAPAAPPALEATAPAIAVHKESETFALSLAANGTVGPLERDRLDAFITDLARDRPEALHARVTGAASSLQLRRVAALLVGDGMAPDKIVLAPDGRAADRAVTVAVDRYTATVPACTPWNPAIAAQSEDDAAGPDVGCSVLANLAAMVADPHDLLRGSTDPDARGTVAAAAVQRYDADKVAPLEPPPQGFSFNVINNNGTGGGTPPAQP